MFSHELPVQAQGVLEKAYKLFDGFSGSVASLQELIVKHFGDNGLIAAYLVAGVLAIVIAMHLVKILLHAIKYLIVPSIAVALIGTMFTSYSFAFLFPASVILFALVLLFKG